MKWNVCYDTISSVLSAFRKVVMMTVTAWKRFRNIRFESVFSLVSFDTYKSGIFAVSMNLDIIMILLIILLYLLWRCVLCIAFDFSISTAKAINEEKYGFSEEHKPFIFILFFCCWLWLMFHLCACSSFHIWNLLILFGMSIEFSIGKVVVKQFQIIVVTSVICLCVSCSSIENIKFANHVFACFLSNEFYVRMLFNHNKFTFCWTNVQLPFLLFE